MPDEELVVDLGGGNKLVFTPKDEEAAQSLQEHAEEIQAKAAEVAEFHLEKAKLEELQATILKMQNEMMDVEAVKEPQPGYETGYIGYQKIEPLLGQPQMVQFDEPLVDIESNIFKSISGAFKDLVKGEQEDPSEEAGPWAKTHGREMLVWYPRKSRQGDYSDHSVNVGWLDYHNVRDLLARFFLMVHENYGRVKNWRENCIGITSRINKRDHPDGECDWHMPMFDYDGKNIKTKVKKDVKKLQKEYGLGDATIFTTQSGLHVYFFSDMVPRGEFLSMFENVSCCKGFTEATQRNGYAVLRLSAKYTEFDIAPYKVIISPNRVTTRPGRKAALVQALLRLGQECGTHFASLYPQWAYYREDPRPWKPPQKRKTGRRVKRVSKEEYEAYAAKKKMVAKKPSSYDKEAYYKVNWGGSSSTTTATTTFNNVWVTTNAKNGW